MSQACLTCQRERTAAIRGQRPHVGSGAYQREKTHCKHGHPYSEYAYVRVDANGRRSRQCRACECARKPSRAHRQYLDEIYARYKGRCAYCGKRLAKHHRDTTLDHVKARSRGGDNDPLNLVLACRPCNSRKQAA